MKFGKLPDISQVDFTLPPDHQQTERILNGGKVYEQLPLYFGCPAWGCKDWVGKIYPPKTPPAQFLQHYARQFSTIELNTTHYRIPNRETIQKWKMASPAGFHFCPKIPQSISHRSNLLEEPDLVTRFCEAILPLEEQLGICFMQLPPHFATDRGAELIHFLQQFPTEVPLSIEFRHSSWFEQNPLADSVFEAMEQLGIMTVITDVAGRRDVLHQRLTGKTAVLRFVGNELHPTDYTRIDSWMLKLKEWQARGLEKVYFFLHEPDDVLCPELTIYFIEQANKVLGLSLKGPKILPKAVQGSLF